MPEIGEVARIVHYIRKHLVGKTVTKVVTNVDEIVYGKVGTSAAEFEKHMTGKKIMSAGQQGKYFWMIMSSPPHPVMHFGMSGWFKIKSEHTYYYRKKDTEPPQEWPPKYMKFLLHTEGDGKTEEAAFVDGRRLGRIRLVDCDGKEIRKHSPLKENGPDPVLDKDLVSLEWLTEKCNKKKVPIKAMLLDQAVISGIGNWVGDEIMYHAKMHPEQYANTLQDSQIKQLYESIHYVCGLSCELLADSDRFPEEWLFKYRWSKAKKSGPVLLPNGNKIEFLTVGGRTSAVVPAVQKKTGPVAADVKDEDESSDKEVKPKAKKTSGKKRKANKEEDDSEEEVEAPAKKVAVQKGKANGVKASQPAAPKKRSVRAKKEDAADEDTDEPIKGEKGLPTRAKKANGVKTKDTESEQVTKKKRGKGSEAKVSKTAAPEVKADESGRRRSGRLRR